MERKAAPTRLALGESQVEGLDQIFAVFNAARHPDETISNAHLQPVFPQHVGMGHDSACCDDGLCGSKVFAQRPWPLDAVHKSSACLRPSDDVKPQHTPVQAITVVLICKVLLGMGCKAGIHDLCHLWMFLQVLCNSHGVFALLPHAQAHRLGGLHDDVGCEWVHDVAMNVLNPLHQSCCLLVLAYYGSACHHVVPLVVLGQALDHHISTVVQGSAHHWGCKCGVDNVPGPGILGYLGNRLEVAQ
mmetsp:Transcript_34538/g.78895  ORF Transcript_34538/g.78895 Transcript_34538/m.78895 type:complete len:245 (+) Transcript_34538:26-760(+)